MMEDDREKEGSSTIEELSPTIPSSSDFSLKFLIEFTSANFEAPRDVKREIRNSVD